MAHDADKELLDYMSVDLNTSPALPTCPPSVGLDVDAGVAGVREALTSGVYSKDTPTDDQYRADGIPQTLDFEVKGGADPADHDGGSVDNGFLGRSRLLSER